jgi:anti-sigma factor RsiW
MTPAERTEDQTVPGCADALVLLMGLIDGELPPGEERRVQDHLAVCPSCRAEYAAYRRLGEATDALAVEDVAVNAEHAWERIYDRLTRSVGWLLLWVGLTLMLGWWLWQLGTVFLMDPEVPLVLRVGVATFVGGLLLLTVNFLRERLYRRKTERYDEVVR